MSLLDELKKEEVWEEFYASRTSGGRLTRSEAASLRAFIDEKRYLSTPEPDVPDKLIISKAGSSKKRTVYCFPENETWMLKLLASLLYRYDGRLSDGCFSFRRGVTAATVFRRIRSIPGIRDKYVFKADIRDYFNSIPAGRLLDVLADTVDDDPELLAFFGRLLLRDRCRYGGEIIEERRGAMAGVPLASFFANFYLLSLDLLFRDEGIPYFRYSDDVLVFADSAEQRDEYYRRFLRHVEEKGLEVNPKKVFFYDPGDGFEFLGFRWKDGSVDLSSVTVGKMKDKIRRKARSVMRRRDRKGYSFEKAARTLIRSMDEKLYDLSGSNDFTWTRFYFPVITVTDGLAEIDRHMVRYLRYLYSGRHYKGNYAVSYRKLKSLGYTSLVNEYYTWKRENARLDAENAERPEDSEKQEN
jgi:hypothetical protein